MCCVLARLSTVALLGFLLVAVSPGDVLAQAAKDPAKPAPPAQAAPVPAAKKDGATKAAPTPTAQAPAAGNPPIPPNVQLTLLIQNAMAAVSQANMTGNYTVLHALAAPSFQQVNPPEKLSPITPTGPPVLPANHFADSPIVRIEL